MRKATKKVFGIPQNVHLTDIKDTLLKFRGILVIYGLLLVLYFIFFFSLRDKMESWMGKEFSLSLSSSLFGDLIFFLFIGFIVSVISAIVTTKPPEDYDFERRATSLANSDAVKDNVVIKNFLINDLNESLAYYRKFEIILTVNEFNTDAQAYLVYLQRDQILTNMCRDRPYLKLDNSFSIDADLEVQNSYGRLSYMHSYNPVNGVIVHKDCDEAANIQLKNGLNKRDVPLNVRGNEEVGIKFGYSTWQRSGDISEQSNWVYFQTARYITQLNIKIINRFATKPIKVDVRRFSYSNNRVDSVKKDLQVPYNSPLDVDMQGITLSTGDRIELYIHPQEAKNV